MADLSIVSSQPLPSSDPIHANPQSVEELPTQEHFDAAHQAARSQVAGDLKTLAKGPQTAPPATGGLSVVSSEPLPPEAPPEPKDWIGATVNAVKHWWDTVNPIDAVKSAAQMTAHPIDALKAYADQNSGILKNAADSFKRGDYAEGVRHVVGYLANGVPGMGAAIDKAGNEAGSGDTSGAVGDTLGIATNLFGPKILHELGAKGKSISLMPSSASASPARQSAVEFADREKIPISTGTRTGNPVARNLEGSLLNTPGGANVARAARAETQSALGKTGTDLTDRLGGSPATPETAGAGVSGALTDLSKSQNTGAFKAYSKLEDIENLPENKQTVTMGHAVDPQVEPTLDKIAQSLGAKSYAEVSDPKQFAAINKIAASMGADFTPKPITKEMALPVDMTSAKAQLKPLLDRLNQEMPLTQQQSSRGLLGIRNVVNGDDFVPASVADQNLSALKQLQRESEHPKTKWLAGQAVSALAPLVDKAVAGAGPEATEALNEGRDLTKAKYATDATLEQLSVEPVQLFNKLASQKDANIELLRDVQSKAPDAIPALARAHLEGLMESALNPEGKPGPQTALSEWNKVGNSTKRILYPDPTLRADLNDFFNLASRVADNPNPSGTAYVTGSQYILKHPVSGIPYVLGNKVLAKLLYTPGGAKLLSRAIRLPGTMAASTAAAGNILKMAGSGAQPLSKSADSEQSAPETVAQR